VLISRDLVHRRVRFSLGGDPRGNSTHTASSACECGACAAAISCKHGGWINHAGIDFDGEANQPREHAFQRRGTTCGGTDAT
jgi:hypothetical protein